MLQDEKNTGKLKTVAKWDSIEDWKKFWHEGQHHQMESMHDLGERVSVEIFREVDDFTK